MNNCLVTKLKGSVDNQNLPKLNVLRLFFKAVESPTSSTNFITIQNDSTALSAMSIKVVSGDARFTTTEPSNWNDHSQGISEISLSPNHATTIFITNADCTIEINSKYDIKMLYLGAGVSFNWNELYAPKMQDFRKDAGLDSLDGSVESLKSMPTDLDVISIPANGENWNITEIPVGLIQTIGSKNLRIIRIDGWVVNDGSTIADLLAGTSILESIFFSGNSVGGNINFFLENGQKKFPNLHTISFSEYNTEFIHSDGDVATLRNLGVNVSIN